MEILKTFEEKISYAVERVRALKEENTNLELKIMELEEALKSKDQEIERLNADKSSVRTQIEELMKVLELMEQHK
ncbi:MAG: cell division protein ZapB [Thermodesulfovibrionales bacterium]